MTSTCRVGSVVNPRLCVTGVAKLRVAGASVMPNVISGNTNASSIMIGEEAAEMVAVEHGVKLLEFVGGAMFESSQSSSRGGINVRHERQSRPDCWSEQWDRPGDG